MTQQPNNSNKHTPRTQDAAQRQHYADWPRCHKSPQHFFVVVCCEMGEGRVSGNYFPRSLNRSFWLFCLGSVSQILRGITDNPKVNNCWSPPTCTRPRSWHPKGISKGYAKNNRLKLVRSLVSELKPEEPKLDHLEDQETGQCNRFLWNTMRPSRTFQKRQHQKG